MKILRLSFLIVVLTNSGFQNMLLAEDTKKTLEERITELEEEVRLLKRLKEIDQEVQIKKELLSSLGKVHSSKLFAIEIEEKDYAIHNPSSVFQFAKELASASS